MSISQDPIKYRRTMPSNSPAWFSQSNGGYFALHIYTLNNSKIICLTFYPGIWCSLYRCVFKQIQVSVPGETDKDSHQGYSQGIEIQKRDCYKQHWPTNNTKNSLNEIKTKQKLTITIQLDRAIPTKICFHVSSFLFSSILFFFSFLIPGDLGELISNVKAVREIKHVDVARVEPLAK